MVMGIEITILYLWQEKTTNTELIGDNLLIILPIVYDGIGGNLNQTTCAIAKKNGLYGIINNKGKEQIPFEYSSITTYHLDGHYLVEKNGKYGIINKRIS